MFRIKICGITNLADALAAIDAGADALGLNFYGPSPRVIGEQAARELVQSLPPHVAKVGVFVNETVDRMRSLADQLGLDFVQLHGDDPPSRIAELAPRQVIRAFRTTGHWEEVSTYLSETSHTSHSPTAVLVDACEPGKYGGTGSTVNWDNVRDMQRRLGRMPVILAGGLKPENIGEAIARAEPAAVDVASGVESVTGRKDPALMRQFVQAALTAWRALERRSSAEQGA
ncbi:MAG: phosphoribosylanthranilate isomerase [Pirellulaceae bacterium]